MLLMNSMCPAVYLQFHINYSYKLRTNCLYGYPHIFGYGNSTGVIPIIIRSK